MLATITSPYHRQVSEGGRLTPDHSLSRATPGALPELPASKTLLVRTLFPMGQLPTPGTAKCWVHTTETNVSIFYLMVTRLFSRILENSGSKDTSAYT